jgi:hypothetical protein
MRPVGFEPTHFTVTDLKTVALTTRPKTHTWVSPQLLHDINL